MKKLKTAFATGALAVAAVVAAPANAALNVEIPDNAYITQNGLNWAWGSPLPYNGNDLSFQASLGWRLPTIDELVYAPLAVDFLFDGANVPFAGIDPTSNARFQATNSIYTNAQSAGACAAAYFNNNFVHCDWQDGRGANQWDWAGTPGSVGWADQLFVRDAAIGAVPEPMTWMMLILGFLGIGGLMRRKNAAARPSTLRVTYS